MILNIALGIILAVVLVIAGIFALALRPLFLYALSATLFFSALTYSENSSVADALVVGPICAAVVFGVFYGLTRFFYWGTGRKWAVSADAPEYEDRRAGAISVFILSAIVSAIVV